MMKHDSFYFPLLCLLLIGSAGWAYRSGQGTQADPYEIADVNDLLELAHNPDDYSSYFLLTADLDMAGAGPFPAAVIAPDTSDDSHFQGPAFNGVFDGQGHVIRNLVIEPNDGGCYIGLFGYAGSGGHSAEIRDLGIEAISIAGSAYNKSVGALVGEIYNGDIKRCFSTGAIALGDGCENIGGLVGYSTSGDVSNSYSQAAVRCGQNAQKVGGLLGGCYSIQCRYTYSAGLVDAGSGSTDVGGFLGANDMFFTSLANFWDIDASGQDVGIIADGLDTVAMFSKTPFLEATWDFVGETANGENDYWKSPTRSYPMLSWQEYTIGLAELAALADRWLTDSQEPAVVYPVDFYRDGRIDLRDFEMLSKSWLGGEMLYGFGELFDGFETGDFSALSWSGEGAVPWQVISTDAYEGAYCAAVQGLSGGQASQLNLEVESSGGKIGFYYMISGGTLSLYIGGSMVGMLGQTAGWTYAEYDLAEGSQSCGWLFYNFSGGSVTARIDNVRIFSPE